MHAKRYEKVLRVKTKLLVLSGVVILDASAVVSDIVAYLILVQQ